MQAGQDDLDVIDITKTIEVTRREVVTTSTTLFGGNDQLAAFNIAAVDDQGRQNLRQGNYGLHPEIV